MATLQQIEQYENTLQKTVDWILTFRNPDGSFGDTSRRKTTQFKLPVALIDNGRRAEALAHMRWLVKETFTAEGDFSDPREGYHAAHWPYRNLWYIGGAHFLEMYEVTFPAWQYVLRFRDPNTGGLRAVAPYADTAADARQNLILTAFLGLTGLRLGDLSVAEKAGDFLCDLIEAQPEMDRRFYLFWRPDSGFVHDVPGGDDRRWYWVERDGLDEDHYNLGMAMTGLSHLYKALKKPRFLEGAKKVHQYFSACREDRFGNVSAGKVMYGLTWMYWITGDPAYLAEAEQSAAQMIQMQGNDGSFIQHGKPYLNIASEYALELKQFIAVHRWVNSQ